MAALQVANRVRLDRARTRRWIMDGGRAEGLKRAIEVLMDPPPHLETMPVHAFLTTIHRFGATRARKILGEEKIGEMRELGRLTLRQRAWLAGELRRAYERLDVEKAA